MTYTDMGYILYDFHCHQCFTVGDESTFEDLVKPGDPAPLCPKCGAQSEKQAFCNAPTVQHSPFWSEVFGKTQAMRNKLTGKVPWRKSSESQTS